MSLNSIFGTSERQALEFRQPCDRWFQGAWRVVMLGSMMRDFQLQPSLMRVLAKGPHRCRVDRGGRPAALRDDREKLSDTTIRELPPTCGRQEESERLPA